MSDKKEISFLIVSDLHENKSKISQFVKMIQEKGIKYDYLLCCGDIVSIQSMDNLTPELTNKYNQLIKEELEELSKIELNNKLYYIPGNHDGDTVNENKEQLTTKAININKEIIKLDDDLYLIGVGGAIPIIKGQKFIPEKSPFEDIDNKSIFFECYPYNYSNDINNYEKSDNDFKKDIEKLIKKVKEESKNDNTNIIMFTHIGPRSVWTNYEVIEGYNAYLGSKTFEEIFFKENGIFLNIHGHTHDSKGLVKICNTKYVVNPGDLYSGNYASLKIKKNDNNKWDIIESFFGYFN